MVYAQTRICPGKWDAKNSRGFGDTNGLPNPGQKIRPWDKRIQKRTCHTEDFTVPVDHRVKIKESKKESQVLGSCQRTKKAMKHDGDRDTNFNWPIWNGLQRIGKRAGKVGNRRTSLDLSKVQHCWNQPEYLEESWRPERTRCQLGTSERSPAWAGVKNWQK